MTLAPTPDVVGSGTSDHQALTDGCHLAVDALKLNDVQTIYGVVGIPITDLARLAQSSGIRYIGFRHESDAVNAAAAAGFLTRKPGMCMTVSGPGFLNGLVALANATTNCFPVVQISGSSERHIVDLKQRRLRGDGPADGGRTVRESGLSRRPAAGHRQRHRPGDPRRGVGPTRRRLSRHAGRGAGRRSRRRKGAASLWQVVDPAPPSTAGARGGLSAPSRLLANAQRPLVVLGKGAAYAQADNRDPAIHRNHRHAVPADVDGQGPDARRSSAIGRRGALLCIGKPMSCMLAGARLNWLLSHGARRCGIPNAKFIQVDISPTEFDSNRAIAAPVVGDIKSVFAAFNAALKPATSSARRPGRDEIGKRRTQNIERMAARLNADPNPMNFSSALRAVRNALRDAPETSTSSTRAPTRSISAATSSTWTCRATASTAAPGGSWASAWAMRSAPPAVTGKPVVAIEGDSAFGFSGMEIETICRYELPVYDGDLQQ